VPCPLIASMRPFVNRSNSLNFPKREFTCIMTFSVAHWDTWDVTFPFWYAMEHVIKRTNGKCLAFTF
jgi:hypothetical protein